jgi:hypothetical protein
MISEVALPGPEDIEAREFLQERQEMLSKLKENLTQAQARMKRHADKKQTERVLEVGDMVYLNMQPYRLSAFGLRHATKLRSKFYGPSVYWKNWGNLHTNYCCLMVLPSIQSST